MKKKKEIDPFSDWPVQTYNQTRWTAEPPLLDPNGKKSSNDHLSPHVNFFFLIYLSIRMYFFYFIVFLPTYFLLFKTSYFRLSILHHISLKYQFLWIFKIIFLFLYTTIIIYSLLSLSGYVKKEKKCKMNNASVNLHENYSNFEKFIHF